MAELKSSLIITLVDRITRPVREVQNSLDRMRRTAAANAAQMSALRDGFLDAKGAGYVLYRGLSAPINAAMTFEAVMADVRKAVDFPTPEAFRRMGSDIRTLSREVPIAADGIAQIVAVAGQSGLSVDELLPFAEMAAKVGVAWDVSADHTGEALAKLKTALGLSVSETRLLADAIHHLGDNSTASAVEILDVVSRVGAQASQFGVTAEEVAAFGAAMVGAGAQSEVAATSFHNMGRALTQGESATARQSAAFAALGLDAAQVARDMQRDAVGTIEDVLSRIQALPDYLRAAKVTDLFGDEARALGPLISNGDLLADTLALIADETGYAGSAQREYAERAQAAGNAAQLFRNRVTDLAISIGDALLPALNSALSVIGPLLTSLSDLAQRYPQITSAVVGLTAAIMAFRVVSIAGQFAGLFMQAALLDMRLAALSAASSVWRLTAAIVLGPAIAAFRSLRGAVIAYTVAAGIAGNGTALKAVGASLLALLSPIRLARVALAALRMALIGTGIGAALVALGAAGAWIYQNWEGMKVAFEAFGGAFMSAIEPVRPALEPVIDAVSSLIDWIGKMTEPVDGMSGAWADFGARAGTAVGEFVTSVVELPGQIIATLKEAAEEIYGAMTAPFRRAASYIGSIKQSIQSWIPFIGGAPLDPSDPAHSTMGVFGLDGARAEGGPVNRGGSYLVGERGPEIFTPGRSGFISPNEIFGELAARRDGAPVATAATSRYVTNNNTFNIYGATGQSVREIGEEVRRAIEGVFADAIA